MFDRMAPSQPPSSAHDRPHRDLCVDLVFKSREEMNCAPAFVNSQDTSRKTWKVSAGGFNKCPHANAEWTALSKATDTVAH